MQIANIITKTLDRTKASGQKLPLLNPQLNSVTCLTHDPVGKAELSNLLFQCFDTLKIYGKEPEQMKSINALFQFVLADYHIVKIREAFVFYLKHNNELPAPSDIVQIIERGGNKPPFEKSVYIAITRKPPEERTSDEWQYMSDYQKFIIRGEN